MIIMTCSIAFNFNSFLINIEFKQVEQIIHTVDTHTKQNRRICKNIGRQAIRV